MTTIKSELLLASKNSVTGDILYTWLLTFPRIILAEVNTHRVASRNTSSSRAIPSWKQRAKVLRDPFLPTSIGSSQKGMQAGEELAGWRRWVAEKAWLWPRYGCVAGAWVQEKLGVHKQIANRLVEPWTWTQQVFSATEVDNFFQLRDHHMAEPHFQELARQMHYQADDAKGMLAVMAGPWFMANYYPSPWYTLPGLQVLRPGEWHLPFVASEDRAAYDIETLKKISAARCARTSYLLPENGARSDCKRDIELFERLAVRDEGSNDPRHLSPLEHPAMATGYGDFYGNFKGFMQFRKEINNEAGVKEGVV